MGNCYANCQTCGIRKSRYLDENNECSFCASMRRATKNTINEPARKARLAAYNHAKYLVTHPKVTGI